MEQTGIKLTVIWDEITTPNAHQRLAEAFAMLLSPRPSPELPKQGIDSED